MENNYPKRKPTRIKKYDYSSVGAYFITICTQDRKRILSEIVRKNNTSIGKTYNNTVGEGLAPPVYTARTNNTFVCQTNNNVVGEGLAPPAYTVRLKPCGEIVEEQLKNLEKRYSNVTIEDYVIMPDHIHAIIFLHKQAGGASPSPTLSDVVCAFKSLSARICKQRYGMENLFQRSFAEHVIRNNEDFDEHVKYIHDNPLKWYYKK